MSEKLPLSLFHFRRCREGRERAVKICADCHCGTDAALGERGGWGGVSSRNVLGKMLI